MVDHIQNPREVTRANIKTQMLTGTYLSQKRLLQIKKTSSDICLICGSESEDIVHILTKCPATDQVRKKYMPVVLNSIPSVYIQKPRIAESKHLLTQYILDPSHPKITDIIDIPIAMYETVESVTRNMCFALHVARTNLYPS